MILALASVEPSYDAFVGHPLRCQFGVERAFNVYARKEVLYVSI
jgi:hypothetical protein